MEQQPSKLHYQRQAFIQPYWWWRSSTSSRRRRQEDQEANLQDSINCRLSFLLFLPITFLISYPLLVQPNTKPGCFDGLLVSVRSIYSCIHVPLMRTGCPESTNNPSRCAVRLSLHVAYFLLSVLSPCWLRWLSDLPFWLFSLSILLFTHHVPCICVFVISLMPLMKPVCWPPLLHAWDRCLFRVGARRPMCTELRNQSKALETISMSCSLS